MIIHGNEQGQTMTVRAVLAAAAACIALMAMPELGGASNEPDQVRFKSLFLFSFCAQAKLEIKGEKVVWVERHPQHRW